MQKSIPYFSQFESPELVKDIIEKKICAKDDQKWRDSGASSEEEYEFWAWKVCGITCLKMILKNRTGETHKLVELAKKAREHGAFIRGEENRGLIYKPFLTYIKEEHGLEGIFFDTTKLSMLSFIKWRLSKGDDVIVSVSPSVRDSSLPTPEHKGGHLVLVTGYDDGMKTISIHNPSGMHNFSQQNYKIPISDFIRFYARRGIVIKS